MVDILFENKNPTPFAADKLSTAEGTLLFHNEKATKQASPLYIRYL